MEDTFSLSEVSDIISNDSDGHLLAQYLKKKSGKVFTRRIFEGNQNRMSIDVCLRKADNNNEKENIKAVEQNNKTNSQNPAILVEETNVNEVENSPALEVNSLNNVSPVRVSGRAPLPSYLRRTPLSSDRLRFSAIKRSARLCGHRALLDAFNNVSESSADAEFAPPLASTPLFSEQQTISENLRETIHKKSTENNTPPFSPRRYTIQKGTTSGQILLTQVPLPNQNNATYLKNTTYTAERHENDNRLPQNQAAAGSSNHLSEFANESRTCVASPKANFEIARSEIETSSSGERTSAKVTTVVEIQQTNSIPIRTCLENQRDSATKDFQQQKSQTTLPNPTTVNMSDIMTDDEEPTSSKRVQKNIDKETVNPESPARKHPLGIRKLRKKRSKDRNEINEILATPTKEASFRKTQPRRCLPLNKPPRTPINGEKFADELKKQLAGLCNRKVLDLRRRKSNSFKKNSSGKSSKIDQPLKLNLKNKTHNQIGNVFSDDVVTVHSPKIGNDDNIGLQSTRQGSQIEKEHDCTITNRNEEDLQSICSPTLRAGAQQREEQTSIGSKENRNKTDFQNDYHSREEQTVPILNENRNEEHLQNGYPLQLEEQTDNNGHEDGSQPDYHHLLPLDVLLVEREVFEDEQSSDRVSFIPKPKKSLSPIKKGRKTKKSKTNGNLLDSYLNATERRKDSVRKLNESKRSLYSEKSNKSQEENLDLSHIRVVSPPPMFRSSTPRKRALPTPPVSPLRNNPSNTEELNRDTQQEDDGVFKKPKGLPPKRKKTNVKAKKTPVEPEANENETTLRRSQRDRKQVPVPYLYKILEQHIHKSMQMAEKRKEKLKLSRIQNSKNNNTEHETLPIASSTKNPTPASSKSRGRKKKNVLTNIPEDDIQNNALSAILPTISESSNLTQRILPETEQISTVQRGESELSTNLSTAQKNKNLRVRIKRLTTNATEQAEPIPPEISSSMSPSSRFPEIADTVDSTPRLTFNFVDWLKGGCSSNQIATNLSQQSFTQISLCNHTELSFKSRQNVEYAFYNTKENNIGYIRLQPGQMKPQCRVRNPVKFLLLSGKIKLNTHVEIGYPKEGDLVTLDTDTRYSLENIGDDVAIILFIKN